MLNVGAIYKRLDRNNVWIKVVSEVLYDENHDSYMLIIIWNPYKKEWIEEPFTLYSYKDSPVIRVENPGETEPYFNVYARFESVDGFLKPGIYATFALQEQIGGRGDPFIVWWIMEEEDDWHEIVRGDGHCYRGGGPDDIEALQGETPNEFVKRIKFAVKKWEENQNT